MEYIFVALVIGLAIYEVVALATTQRGDTISEIVWQTTQNRPIVPFLAGLLMGHFFWQQVP